MSSSMAKKTKVKEDRLSDLPDSILIHILSLLCENSEDSKKVVRTSILSTRWLSLWKSVQVSLDFRFSSNLSYTRCPKNGIHDFIISTHRELHYWRSCQKISKFIMVADFPDANRFAKDVDLWVYFAAEIGNVEHFELECGYGYQFPQFAYKNTSWRKLVIRSCTLNPLANVKWSGIVSLSFRILNLTDHVMEKILSGCPNLECLKFYHVFGLHRLEISNKKLTKLIIEDFDNDDDDIWLEIIAPYIQNLEILGVCEGICLRNVASLVTAVLNFDIDFDFDSDDDDEEEDLLQEMQSTCLKELLYRIAHVEKLELGPRCIEYLSKLELEGWQPPQSSWKFLQLSTNLEQLDFAGICSFLLSSSDLETLVIDGYKETRIQLLTYINEDEQIKRFENLNGSFPHLKTIKILNFSKSSLPLVKYLLKHAIVLEKFVIDARRKRSDVCLDYVKMEQELQSFPRSSPQASVIFSYG